MAAVRAGREAARHEPTAAALHRRREASLARRSRAMSSVCPGVGKLKVRIRPGAVPASKGDRDGRTRIWPYRDGHVWPTTKPISAHGESP